MSNKAEKLKQLRMDLESMRSMHAAAWEMYGSELASGDMIRKESELEKKIEIAEAEVADEAELNDGLDNA